MALADFKPCAPVDPASPAYRSFVAAMADFFAATMDTCTIGALHTAVYLRARAQPALRAQLCDERQFLALLKLAADNKVITEDKGTVTLVAVGGH